MVLPNQSARSTSSVAFAACLVVVFADLVSPAYRFCGWCGIVLPPLVALKVELIDDDLQSFTFDHLSLPDSRLHPPVMPICLPARTLPTVQLPYSATHDEILVGILAVAVNR